MYNWIYTHFIFSWKNILIFSSRYSYGIRTSVEWIIMDWFVLVQSRKLEMCVCCVYTLLCHAVQLSRSSRCNGPLKTVDLLGEALKMANYLRLHCIRWLILGICVLNTHTHTCFFIPSFCTSDQCLLIQLKRSTLGVAWSYNDLVLFIFCCCC